MAWTDDLMVRDPWWFKIIRWTILTWVWLFIFMWLGYLTLDAFGQIDPPRDNPGPVLVTTTQANPLQ